MLISRSFYCFRLRLRHGIGTVVGLIFEVGQGCTSDHNRRGCRRDDNREVASEALPLRKCEEAERGKTENNKNTTIEKQKIFFKDLLHLSRPTQLVKAS